MSMAEPAEIKIIDKVRKLLSLATSSNANEAQSAMLKAQELMIRNGLSMTDVSDIRDKKVTDSSTNRVGRFPWYAYDLGNVIAENFRCYMVVNSNKQTRMIRFIGLESDANMAIEVYNFAFHYLKEQIKSFKLNFKKEVIFVDNKDLNAYGNDFARGFINGLRYKFKNQIEEQQWGLVLVKDDAVIKHYNDMKVGTSKNTTVTSAGNDEAWLAGYVVGKDFEMIAGVIG